MQFPWMPGSSWESVCRSWLLELPWGLLSEPTFTDRLMKFYLCVSQIPIKCTNFASSEPITCSFPLLMYIIFHKLYVSRVSDFAMKELAVKDIRSMHRWAASATTMLKFYRVFHSLHICSRSDISANVAHMCNVH